MRETSKDQTIKNYWTRYKVCSKCKKNRLKSSFNKDSSKEDRLQTNCRDCKRKAQKKDYEKKKSIYMDRQRLRRSLHPEKKSAHDKVRKAIIKGVLTRPSQCSKCGNSKQRIEAHHHKGYEPENALDVIFLCTSCHRAEENS